MKNETFMKHVSIYEIIFLFLSVLM